MHKEDEKTLGKVSRRDCEYLEIVDIENYLAGQGSKEPDLTSKLDLSLKWPFIWVRARWCPERSLKTSPLSTFCLSLRTVKWSKVTVGRERAGSKAFSRPSNFLCTSLPALVLHWEKGRSDNQFSPIELKLKLLPLAWTQTELGKDWCHHPHRGRRSIPLMGSSHAGTASQLLLAPRLMAFRIRAITSSGFVVPGRTPTQHQQAGLNWKGSESL